MGYDKSSMKILSVLASVLPHHLEHGLINNYFCMNAHAHVFTKHNL